MIRSRKIAVIPLCALLLFLSAVACNKDEQPPRAHLSVKKQKYNVLLITLDTVRADALQVYDPNGAPVPSLQELANHSIVFEKAISQIPYTLPSHSSMFTGTYPISHGVIDNVRGVLPDNLPTLAEAFRKQGYDTAGFLGSLILSRPTSMNRGFEYYDDYFNKAALIGAGIDRIERKAEEVFYSFQHWFEKREPGKNFFAFLHFYDAHAPYEPPAYFAPQSEDLKKRYLGEIRYIDFVIGKVLRYLNQDKGVLNNTVVLVESDHGEMFHEHEELGHGFYIYEPVVHVPFILLIPSVETQTAIRIPDTVELVDLAPTLLDLTNIPAPQSMQGKSLLPLVEGGAKKDSPAYSETYLAALELGVSPLLSIRNDRYKYIDTALPELYDLETDPQEETNLVAEKKSVASDLKRELSDYKRKYFSSARTNRTVSTEEVEQFAALGYLGGEVPEEQWNLKKDAKEYIDGWNQVIQIRLLIHKRQYRQALALIEKTKRSMPAKMDALKIHEADCYSALQDYKKSEEILLTLNGQGTLLPLAQIYLKTGREKKAVGLYRTELNKKFELHKLYNFVFLLKMAGRNDEALRLVKELQHSEHDPDEARPYLAEMFYVLEQWDDMEKYALELVELRPWELKWYLLLCDSYEEQKKYETALALMRKGKSRFGNHPSYLQRVGNLTQLAERLKSRSSK